MPSTRDRAHLPFQVGRALRSHTTSSISSLALSTGTHLLQRALPLSPRGVRQNSSFRAVHGPHLANIVVFITGAIDD